MIHSKALFSVLAFSVGLSFGVVDLGWSQDQTQDRERLQIQDQLKEQDQNKKMLREKEQLHQQLRDKEMKQERLEKGIRSQGRSQAPNFPSSGGGGKSRGMGGRGR
jgi:uncharacterized protein HemX